MRSADGRRLQGGWGGGCIQTKGDGVLMGDRQTQQLQGSGNKELVSIGKDKGKSDPRVLL